MKKNIVIIIFTLALVLPMGVIFYAKVIKPAQPIELPTAVELTAPEEKIDLDAYPILKVALKEEGNTGGEKFWQWYGFDEHVLWCACYVSWCANELDYLDDDIIPRFASCRGEGVPWFKDRGQWEDADYSPNPADIIFFDLREDDVPNHVGFVILAEDDMIYTIEGNAGNVCKKKEYASDDPRIYGYGIPKYPQ